MYARPCEPRRVDGRTRTDDGVLLAWRAWGPSGGPVVVCQHGFPDSPATWRLLAPALAARGWRVVAPWLRGYPPSGESPGRVGRVRVGPERLAADLEAVRADVAGDRPALLVGHDWGAIAAWHAAAEQDRWAGLVALAVPPPAALHRFRRDPVQALGRSSYIALLGTPGAHLVVRRALLARLRRRWSVGGALGEEDEAELRRLTRSGHVPASALAPYRWLLTTALRGGEPLLSAPLPRIPTSYLHGAEDRCIHASYAVTTASELPGGADVRVVPGAGHWVHLDQPALVLEAVLATARRADLAPRRAG